MKNIRVEREDSMAMEDWVYDYSKRYLRTNQHSDRMSCETNGWLYINVSLYDMSYLCIFVR